MIELIKHIIISAVCSIVLIGCAVPPPIQIANFVADGASYIFTSKSTTDHAISAVMKEDCALLRIVKDKEICEEIITNEQIVQIHEEED